MGKSRARKTRWRALDIADGDRSDSEESNTNSSAISSRFNGSYHQAATRYYGKYSYSSQSTPRRKYQYDSSTKSTRSSSTTSETKITFNDDEYTRITTPRQDVLFKKGYLNKPKAYQTQTSTGTSTISTGNSTENGTPDHQSADLDYESQFVFPNGFVDQNGIYYVNSYEYPLMLFNPPTYYHEFLDSKAKRYSTGSLTESMSPNNEEVTSQDLSQSGGETSNNVSDYAGQPLYNIVYPGYYVEGPCPPNDLAKNPVQPSSEPVKKLKKRRERKTSKTIPGESSENSEDEKSSDDAPRTTSKPKQPLPQEEKIEEIPKTDENITVNGCADPKTEQQPQKYCLKPDAEEFVPRSYQNLQVPVHHQPPPTILPANFVPVPIVPLNEFGAPAAFIPPGIPINFVPHAQKIFQPLLPPPPSPQSTVSEDKEEKVQENLDKQNIGTEKPSSGHKNGIDIETIVSKLEEAAKEQELTNGDEDAQKATSKSYKNSPKFNRSPFKRNNFNNRYRSSPVRNGDFQEDNNVPSAPSVKSDSKQPVNFKKSWTPTNGYHNANQKYQNGFSSPKRHSNYKHATPNLSSNKNYSEILKKPQAPVIKKHITIEKPPLGSTPTKASINSITNAPNQWISVASRKKKKGKNVEDSQLQDTFEEESNKDDEFETYDVNLLEDVVPPTKEEPKAEEQTQIEEILTTLAQEITNTNNEAISMVEVSDIEKDLIIKIETEPQSEGENLAPKETKDEVIIKEEEVVLQSSTNEVPTPSEEIKTKKKSKKGTQKAPTKKVIITDIDFSEVIEQSRPQINTAKLQKNDEDKSKVDVVEPEEKIKEPVAEEKKAKKKKKNKTPKPEIKESTPTKLDEAAYDFLLEKSLLDDSSDKTNFEVSLELDKLIQKGMYSNLKERIKSFDIDATDDAFFRTLPTNKQLTDGLTKTPDFNRIFQSTRQFLKPNSVSVDALNKDSRADDTNETLDPDAADSASGSFLEVPSEDNLKSDDPNDVNAIDNDYSPKEEESKKLYPITEAVKEWMSKTREATPEVELLKSPSTIYKEFGVDDDPRETQTDDLDEEVTLFSAEEGVAQQDLLEFWENDIPDAPITPREQTNDKCCEKCDKNEILDGEEAIEVYESRYGQNEAYLSLHREMKEKETQQPKHGGLPYRAICCSLQ